jgi:hypothetical protein
MVDLDADDLCLLIKYKTLVGAAKVIAEKTGSKVNISTLGGGRKSVIDVTTIETVAKTSELRTVILVIMDRTSKLSSLLFGTDAVSDPGRVAFLKVLVLNMFIIPMETSISNALFNAYVV